MKLVLLGCSSQGNPTLKVAGYLASQVMLAPGFSLDDLVD